MTSRPFNPPYLTSSSLLRTLNCLPLQQAQVVDSLRLQRASGQGFNPWSKLCGAIRQDLRFRTGHQRLQAAVAQPPNHFSAQYRDLAVGWRRFLASFGGPAGMGEARLQTAVEFRSGLTISLSPQVGLVHPDGRVEVIQLWFDTTPLAEITVQGLLYLMQTKVSTLYLADETASVLYRLQAMMLRLTVGCD